MKNFVEELRWRGMIQDIMPETEQHLMEGLRAAYVGIDPTAIAKTAAISLMHWWVGLLV